MQIPLAGENLCFLSYPAKGSSTKEVLGLLLKIWPCDLPAVYWQAITVL